MYISFPLRFDSRHLHQPNNHCSQKTLLICSECSAQLSDRRSLNKHLQKRHNIYPNVPTFSCSNCSEEKKCLPSLRKHSLVSHHQPISKVCYLFRMGFQSKDDYANHVNNERGLRVPELDLRETNPSTPILSSIKGGINYYELVPQVNDLEILKCLFKKRSEIEDFIKKHTNQFPQKVQLIVEKSLQKLTDEDPEKITVNFNTHYNSILYGHF